jgi:GH15 family glucan-1,4-alpha-glucosidase
MRDGFVMRYDTRTEKDGLLPGEGAFLACSFWLADAYISIGRREDAKKLFKRLLSIRNDLGLLAEEYEPRHKRHQGNFPQAFSHVALINTAFNLTRAEKPQEQRADGNREGSPKGDAAKVAAPGEIKRREASSASR